MTRSCKRVFAQRGCFLFDYKIYIYINKQIPFKDYLPSRKSSVTEQTVQWEQW